MFKNTMTYLTMSLLLGQLMVCALPASADEVIVTSSSSVVHGKRAKKDRKLAMTLQGGLSSAQGPKGYVSTTDDFNVNDVPGADMMGSGLMDPIGTYD